MTPTQLILYSHTSAILAALKHSREKPELIKKYRDAAAQVNINNTEWPNLRAMRNLIGVIEDLDSMYIISARLDACEHIVKDTIDIAGTMARQLITAEQEKHSPDEIKLAYLQIDNLFELCQNNDTNPKSIEQAIQALHTTSLRFTQDATMTVTSLTNHMQSLITMLL